MNPKVLGFIIILGALLAVGIDTSQLVTLALLVLLLVCTFSLIVRGKWLPQFGGSLVGLLVGPCVVAAILRSLFAQLNLHFLPHLSLGWTGWLWLALGLLVAALISYFVVKRRLRFLQEGPAPVTNERQPIYAPRRRELPEE